MAVSLHRRCSSPLLPTNLPYSRLKPSSSISILFKVPNTHHLRLCSRLHRYPAVVKAAVSVVDPSLRSAQAEDKKLLLEVKDSGPAATFQVHEHLRPKLCDLYENDSIFDKFDCCLSGDGLRVATGSYGNLFRTFGFPEGSSEGTTLEASKNPMRKQAVTPPKPSRSLTRDGCFRTAQISFNL